MSNRIKAIVSLCVLTLSAVAFVGCNKSDSTPDEAETSSSQVSTSSVASTTAKATETEALTQAVATETENVYVADNNESAENEEPQYATVNVEGKAYTLSVGDTLNYVFYLKTPEALEDFQATTNYDSSMLELVETETDEMFPVAGGTVVCNSDMPNVIKYNAVNLSGMDFTKGGYLVSFKFRVLDCGGTAISTTLEYMDSVKSEPYVSDYKIVGDITYSEKII